MAKRYRFKTKEEFIEEFGTEWHDAAGWIVYMEFLCGQTLAIEDCKQLADCTMVALEGNYPGEFMDGVALEKSTNFFISMDELVEIGEADA